MSKKVVLVTGASSGLGKEIALAFGKQGAIVGLMARRKDRLSAVAAEIKRSGGTGLVLQVDLSVDQELTESFQSFMRQVENKLDVLVNNAAMGIFGRNPTMEEYLKIYQVNVHSVFQLTNLALPYLQKKSGNIINLGSSVVERPFVGEIVYTATKGAITAMTKAQAAAFGKSGIRVNLIQPGIIDSEFNVTAGLPKEMNEIAYRISADLNVMATTGYSQDVAQAALFLASDQARFITGATLKVDGGITLAAIRP